MKFFKCNDCDDVVLQLFDSHAVGETCKANKTEITVGTVDAAYEKHVPHITKEGDIIKVQIGEVEHPMIPEHYIVFVVAEKENGFELINLKPGDRPYVEFDAEGVKAVYEFCNLHCIWKAEL